MFTGLSGFPLTPLRDDRFDEASFEKLIERLVNAGIDSIGALGSTGSYAYLTREERRRVARAAVEAAGDVPVIVGIGALRTSQAQALAEDAQNAGASAVLLSTMTYQALTDDDVFGLYEDITAGLSVPLVLYDNPSTTHFHFSTELYGRIAELPQVASIKIPPVSPNVEQARSHVQAIRAVIPENVTIGISGDAAAATGLIAGCDVWYSVIAGTLPEVARDIAAAATSGDAERARAASERLQPLWQLFSEFGSVRVVAAILERLGLVGPDSLPRPILGLDAASRERVSEVLTRL